MLYKQEENPDCMYVVLIMYFKPYVFFHTYYSHSLFKPEDQLFMAEDADIPQVHWGVTMELIIITIAMEICTFITFSVWVSFISWWT